MLRSTTYIFSEDARGRDLNEAVNANVHRKVVLRCGEYGYASVILNPDEPLCNLASVGHILYMEDAPPPLLKRLITVEVR